MNSLAPFSKESESEDSIGKIWKVGIACLPETIGEKVPPLVPILRPVPDLVICKKHPPDLLLCPQDFKKDQIIIVNKPN